MEIQIASPFAEHAQELATAQHSSVQDWIYGLIAQEAASYEIEKKQLRELLLERVAEADKGLGDDIDTVFRRIKSNITH